MNTETYAIHAAHSEAESLWHFNFADRPTEEFAGLREVCQKELRRGKFRAMLPAEQSFLHYQLAALNDSWCPLEALSGHANIGTRHGEYETLRKVPCILLSFPRRLDQGGGLLRASFRLAETAGR